MFSTTTTTTTSVPRTEIGTIDEHPRVKQATEQLQELEANLRATEADLARLRKRRTALAREVLDRQAGQLLAKPGAELPAAADAELAQIDGELNRIESRVVALVTAVRSSREASATVRVQAAEEIARQTALAGDDLIREMLPLVHRVIELNNELIMVRGGANASPIQTLVFPVHPGILDIWLAQPQVQQLAVQLEAEALAAPASKRGRK